MLKKTDVAFKGDIDVNFLPLITALMVFISSIALSTVFGINSILNNWEKDLAGHFTVQVLPFKEVKSKKVISTGDIEKRTNKVIEILNSTRGVNEAKVISEVKIKKMLSPWLGTDWNLKDAPVPVLIDVKLDDYIPVNINGLELRLRDSVKGTKIENHKDWLIELKDIARAIKLIASFIIIMIIITTSIAISYSTSSSLKIHKPTIKIMHIIGAHDNYISEQFSNRVFNLTLIGGVIGLLISLTSLYIMILTVNKSQGSILGSIDLGFINWFFISIIPFIAIAITTITTKKTVIKTLHKML